MTHFTDFREACRQEAPQVAIVLGSGLGGVVNHVEVHESLQYNQIPGWPSTGVKGHRGRITLGQWGLPPRAPERGESRDGRAPSVETPCSGIPERGTSAGTRAGRAERALSESRDQHLDCPTNRSQARDARPSLGVKLGPPVSLGGESREASPPVSPPASASGLGPKRMAEARPIRRGHVMPHLPVLVFEGRFHYYEGHPWEVVVQPIHLAHHLGVRRLVITNSAGGIAETLGPGDLMVLKDHLFWPPAHFGFPTFQSAVSAMSAESAGECPYQELLRSHLAQAARQLDLTLGEGVYAQVMGPCYETPAEVRALRWYGADAVGMSTGVEVEVGRSLGMECLGLSCITNKGAGLGLSGVAHSLSHEEVMIHAAAAEAKVGALLGQFLAHLPIK